MGNFSWILAPKKGEPVDPRRRAIEFTGPYWLLRPGQDPLLEESYDGYGTFGGQDVFIEMAKWYGVDDPEADEQVRRMVGINLDCEPDYGANGESTGYKEAEIPIKIIGLNPDGTGPDSFDYDDYDASPSDPDQGWPTEDEGHCWNCGMVQ